MSLCEPGFRVLERAAALKLAERAVLSNWHAWSRRRRRAAVAVVVSLALVAIAKAYQKLVVVGCWPELREREFALGDGQAPVPQNVTKMPLGVAHAFQGAGCSSGAVCQ
jgi:hypothetical protein